MIFNRLILLNYFVCLEANRKPLVYNAETPAGDDAAGAMSANRRDCTCCRGGVRGRGRYVSRP
jgi:hypothetical protein